MNPIRFVTSTCENCGAVEHIRLQDWMETVQLKHKWHCSFCRSVIVSVEDTPVDTDTLSQPNYHQYRCTIL